MAPVGPRVLVDGGLTPWGAWQWPLGHFPFEGPGLTVGWPLT